MAVHPRTGALVNVAGVFSSQRVETADGLELMFATNHIGPFLLTNLLLPALTASGAARVLTVAAPSGTKLKFDDLQGRSASSSPALPDARPYEERPGWLPPGCQSSRC
jgi:NAD(P)-dependent dehydrogenase (short-subunit alcohol dehydrogenase family)